MYTIHIPPSTSSSLHTKRMTSNRERMTNPFAILTLHAIHSYQKAMVELSSNQQSIIPKILIYTVGTSLLATVIYKKMKKNQAPTQTPPYQRPYNFLYTLSLPFKYLLYKMQCTPTPTSTSTSTPTPTNPPPPPFEDKYFNEYDEWSKSTDTNETSEDHKKECLENMYYSTVRETINDFYGDVIMCYDHKTLSFAYYARTGNIPYKYLETISRKYMIETNAPKEIHVDIRSEYQKAVTATAPAPETTTTTTTTATAPDTDTALETDIEESESTVFVKLKSYNNATNLKTHTNTNDKTTDKNDTFVKPESKTKTNANPNVILRENANRYSYRGKIDDFTEHHKVFLAERRTSSAPAATSSSSSATPATHTTTGYAEFKKQRSAL